MDPEPAAPLLRALDELDGKEVTVKVRAERHGSDEEEADRIHRLLLKKQRATGSLGLNE